jgi:hypothetical protein
MLGGVLGAIAPIFIARFHLAAAVCALASVANGHLLSFGQQVA